MADEEDTTEEMEQLKQAPSTSKATPTTNARTGNAAQQDQT
jgi:hypothetical protein